MDNIAKVVLQITVYGVYICVWCVCTHMLKCININVFFLIYKIITSSPYFFSPLLCGDKFQCILICNALSHQTDLYNSPVTRNDSFSGPLSSDLRTPTSFSVTYFYRNI